MATYLKKGYVLQIKRFSAKVIILFPLRVGPFSKGMQKRSQVLPHFKNCSLRKHAISNILRILSQKNETFQMKISGSFHISAQT